MSKGRLGVVQGAHEVLHYTDASNEAEVAKLLQVDLSLQKELRE